MVCKAEEDISNCQKELITFGLTELLVSLVLTSVPVDVEGGIKDDNLTGQLTITFNKGN
jgi:hypothetical protein